MTTTTQAKQSQLILSERGTNVQIVLQLPDFYSPKKAKQLEDAFQQAKKLEKSVKDLTKASQENKQSWDLLQNLLYYWNHRDIFKLNKTGDFSQLVELGLREVTYQYAQHQAPVLECANSFTTKKAVKELRDRALAHRINSHPLLESMSKNGLSTNEIRLFLENYYVNNRLFHLFIAALSQSCPLEERVELACNFYDEMGSGDPTQVHPTLFLESFNGLGEPKSITPLPEALFLANEKTYAAMVCGDPYYGLGGFGFIELTMPDQMTKILKGLSLSGLPKEDLIFWETHITIDLEHGETWFSEMERIIQTPEAAQSALAGGLRLLEARSTFYDGVLRSL